MRDWRLLLRHNHWLTLRIVGHEAHICARCSGTVLGYLTSQLLQPLIFSIGFGSLDTHWQLALAYALALPSGIDWLTQTWNLRMSTNRIRFSAGFLIGTGAALLGLSSLPHLTKLLILAYSSLAVASIGYLGRRLMRQTSPSPKI